MDYDTKYRMFEELVDRHRWLIRRLCWRQSGYRRKVCDELVQDCYITIWVRLPMLQPGCDAQQEAAWIKWQCRHALSLHGRKRPANWIPIDEKMAETLAAPDGNALQEQIGELSPDLSAIEKKIVEMLLEGYENKDMAETLNISLAKLKRMRRITIEKMKEKYNNITNQQP